MKSIKELIKTNKEKRMTALEQSAYIVVVGLIIAMYVYGFFYITYYMFKYSTFIVVKPIKYLLGLVNIKFISSYKVAIPLCLLFSVAIILLIEIYKPNHAPIYMLMPVIIFGSYCSYSLLDIIFEY